MKKSLYVPEGTPNSRQLCEEISEHSDGCCIMAFSRGKDSLATLLWLRQFFDRIFLYHCAITPHLSYADESLDHYEKFFGLKIERYMHADAVNCLKDMVYQPIEDEETIESLNVWNYDTWNIADIVREKYDIPKAWLAFGITGADSIFRRRRMEKSGGKNPDKNTFYPCFDWKRNDIVSAVEKSGCKLPADYLVWDRTVNGVPDCRPLFRMEEQFPEDLAKLENYYPFLRAIMARDLFRQHRFPPKKKVTKKKPPNKKASPKGKAEAEKTKKKVKKSL